MNLGAPASVPACCTWKSRRRGRRRSQSRLMASTHVQISEVFALHEPEGRARQSPARRLCIAKLRRARSDAPYRFMVPMHDTIDVRALHEPGSAGIRAGVLHVEVSPAGTPALPE